MHMWQECVGQQRPALAPVALPLTVPPIQRRLLAHGGAHGARLVRGCLQPGQRHHAEGHGLRQLILIPQHLG